MDADSKDHEDLVNTCRSEDLGQCDSLALMLPFQRHLHWCYQHDSVCSKKFFKQILLQHNIQTVDTFAIDNNVPRALIDQNLFFDHPCNMLNNKSLKIMENDQGKSPKPLITVNYD